MGGYKLNCGVAKNCYYLKIFFLLIVLSYFCIGETFALSATDDNKTCENIYQGTIALFSQNYSEDNNFSNNVFIAKIQENNTYDQLYTAFYGDLEPQIMFNDSSKALEYKTTRDSSFSHSLFPVADVISDLGIRKFSGDSIKSLETDNFCKAASIPLIHYNEQPKKAGSLYICNLAPMVKSAYQFSIDIDTDDKRGFILLNSPGSKIIIQEIDNATVLTSYFQTASEDIEYKTIQIENSTERSNFEITFDGYNKTNTISTKNGSYIVTPFYKLERQRLPYVDFSNGYLKFTAFLMGKGSYVNLDMYNLNQKAGRKLITPLGSKKIIPFGLDGPHARNTIEQGINYLKSKNSKGTIWCDVNYLEQYNETDLEYLRTLASNDSWDLGIHYSEELNSLSLEQAYKVMDSEYLEIYEKTGKKPTSWCSLRNEDNVTHAIYAYEKLGMFWRNGDAGVNAEKKVGNLDDDTWEWWDTASRKGMIYPAFTHELDQEPAIKYSISNSKFRNWADNYFSDNISITSLYEYNQINRNTYDAYFDNLKCKENFVKFDAHTNGARTLINVNIQVGENTQVYDDTLKEYLNYTSEKDKSITFWVENPHTYSIYLNGKGF
jgi:hypothetical protein